MKSLLLSGCLLLSPAPTAPASAQDEAEALQELDEEIRRAEARKSRLQRRVELTERRIQLLQRLRRDTAALIALEPKFEEAEQANNEDKLEQLEEQSGRLERQCESGEVQLMLLDQRVELLELSDDLGEPELKRYRGDGEALLKVLDDLVRVREQLLEAANRGQEDRVERLEESFEQMHDRFEVRREILQLRVELFWAREEDDEEAVEELQQELKGLGAQAEPEVGENAPKPTAPPALELTAAELRATGALDFQTQIVPLLRSACFDCHQGAEAEGELDLAGLIQVRPLVSQRSRWQNVIQQLKVRSMPPADAAQPTDADRRKLAGWLTHALESFDYDTVRQPGYEPARRLTHEEYNNTIRDLTGLDLRPADRFPQDLTASSGFENSANSLFLQPVLLERYVGAAEAIVAAAYPDQRTDQDGWGKLLKGRAAVDRTAVEALLRDFVSRAWRRPVTAEELTRLVTHWQRRRDDGVDARAALADVIEVILISPEFLIRVEQDTSQPGKRYAISDYELASRLSYFLWASMPDDELFSLAASGRLQDPAILTAQVDRMLNDKRSGTLGTLFAAQWLGFADLDRVQRDQIDNPWATDSLVAAMKAESAMLFNDVVRTGKPLERLIDADYTFINAELARHYRIRDVAGDAMQRVSLRNNPRRGVLGHASILAVTSFPGRTSPVLRGNWILTRLLGTPPPPPPPNVSQFDDRVAENERLTSRQKLELHRRNPHCYGCHSQIDPLGFGLEKFEWFGRYRPERRGRRVDATGQLAGRTFNGLHGLSEALVESRMPDLSRQITRSMLTYALGRQLEYYDEAVVRELVEGLQANQRSIRSLIHGIVQSEPFRMKQR